MWLSMPVPTLGHGGRKRGTEYLKSYAVVLYGLETLKFLLGNPIDRPSYRT